MAKGQVSRVSNLQTSFCDRVRGGGGRGVENGGGRGEGFVLRFYGMLWFLVRGEF